MEFNQSAYDGSPSNGWLKVEEAKLLWSAADATTGPILEIGCYYGKSTCLLATLGRPMYCIDPFENFDSDDMGGRGVHKSFLQNLSERNIQNVELFCKRCEDWDRREVGFAYLDGDHTFAGTIDQIRVAKLCGVKTMCLHDYANSGGDRHIKMAVKKSRLKILALVHTMVHVEVR